MQLDAILAQREQRWNTRREYADRYGVAVLALTLNMPGADKNPEGSGAAFALLQHCLRQELASARTGETCILAEQQWQGADGPCWIASIALPPLQLKALCVAVEEKHPLGRLADADVMDAQGQPVTRADVGNTARRCFVCDAPASLCRREGRHKREEIMEYVHGLLRPAPHSSERVGALAARAALLEAATSPKPGLVCRHDNGAHKDMDYATFVRSAEALQPYFTAAHALGRATARSAPQEVFPRLRALGVNAEACMLAATNGINTHKGLIFSLGLFCAAAGRLARVRVNIHDICATAASFCRGIVRADLAALPCVGQAAQGLWPELSQKRAQHALPRTLRPLLEKRMQRPLTPGEVIYILYGVRGVRGEAEQGFPHVVLAWNALHKHGMVTVPGMVADADANRAMAHTLLELVARVEDSSVLWRGGSRGLALAKAYARGVLTLGGLDSAAGCALLERMGAAFVRRRLSPGGCADVLAIAAFLHLLQAPAASISHLKCDNKAAQAALRHEAVGSTLLSCYSNSRLKILEFE